MGNVSNNPTNPIQNGDFVIDKTSIGKAVTVNPDPNSEIVFEVQNNEKDALAQMDFGP
jgi:hypothetical protein